MSEFMTIEGKSHIQLDEAFSQNAKVKVIGVGGAGGNALNRMKEMNIQNVEFIAINTDALALEHNLADDKIAIGKETTKNLGAGARPEVGRKAILEDRATVEEKLKGADMIFIAAGMGGGTGTGAAPVVAEIARSLGILTVAVVSMPFMFEGPVRRRNAKAGMAALKEMVDSIIVINNQNIFKTISKDATTEQAFRVVDEVLGNAVRGVCDIIMRPGTINIDFQDIRRIMENGGTALMGTGVAEGEDRALKAAEAAITCPLLGDVNVKGSSAVLVNISHGENFTMMELDAAMTYLSEAVGISMDEDFDEGNEEIIFGDCILPELGDKLSITVFATKFYGDIREVPQTMQNAAVAPTAVAPVPTQVVPQVAPAVQPVTHTAPAPQNVNPFSRREQSAARPTTNFGALLTQPVANKQEVKATVEQTTMQFNGFANTQDIRAIGAQEEEFNATITHKPTISQPSINEAQPTFAQPVINDKPAFSEPPTMSQPAVNANDSVAGGLDLSAPPVRSEDLYKSDTRTMESYRSGFTGNAEF